MIQQVLTEVPPVDTKGTAARRCELDAHYRALVQHIQAANVGAAANQAIETIGITSCARGAGVTTVAFNLAVAAARADIGPILLVDADITKQANRSLFPESPTLGLADALADAADPMDCVVSTPIVNLSSVAGRGKAKHDELTFDPFKTAELLDEYKSHFKLLVVDIPAPSTLNSSVYLAGQLDGVLLVIESELSDARIALRTKQQLVDANANLLGVVLNKGRTHMPSWLENLL